MMPNRQNRIGDDQNAIRSGWGRIEIRPTTAAVTPSEARELENVETADQKTATVGRAPSRPRCAVDGGSGKTAGPLTNTSPGRQ